MNNSELDKQSQESNNNKKRYGIGSNSSKWIYPGIVGWMRGKENNEAINLLHARQRQEFLNEERTQKERRTGATGNTRKDKKQEALEKRSRHRQTQQDTILFKKHLYKTK
jgi:hypothetical protein